MKGQKHPPIVNFAILTVVLTLSWVFFTIYRSLTQKPEEVVPEEVLLPLNSRLDQTILNKLKEKYYVDEENIQDTSATAPEVTPKSSVQTTPTPLPEPENTPTASPSASL